VGKTKSHSVCQVRDESCNLERELEWRQEGELWETRKNSFRIVWS